jgi:hypothetical protein
LIQVGGMLDDFSEGFFIGFLNGKIQQDLVFF